MRYNVGRCVVMIMVMVMVVGGLVATLGAGNTGSGTDTHGQAMSRTAWTSARAMGIEEDDPRWDCRVMGNTECGAPDYAWYELVCPEDVTQDTCVLERHPLTPAER